MASINLFTLHKQEHQDQHTKKHTLLQQMVKRTYFVKIFALLTLLITIK